ncbi:hypothetical protein LZ32DRAFT_47407 [Colletotrichum eremochloae]|nr:hypothetical protein LZ32DRAFT_47407 [Colletotrichum eremochloae]
MSRCLWLSPQTEHHLQYQRDRGCDSDCRSERTELSSCANDSRLCRWALLLSNRFPYFLWLRLGDGWRETSWLAHQSGVCQTSLNDLVRSPFRMAMTVPCSSSFLTTGPGLFAPLVRGRRRKNEKHTHKKQNKRNCERTASLPGPERVTVFELKRTPPC